MDTSVSRDTIFMKMLSSVTVSGRLFKICNLYTLYDFIEIIIYTIILFIPNIMFSFSFTFIIINDLYLLILY